MYQPRFYCDVVNFARADWILYVNEYSAISTWYKISTRRVIDIENEMIIGSLRLAVVVRFNTDFGCIIL